MSVASNVSGMKPACGTPRRHDPTACLGCAVRDVSFCSALDDVETGGVGGLVQFIAKPAGTLIAGEGDRVDHLLILTSGAARLCKLTADGRRQIVGFLFPGDFLGGAAPRHGCDIEAVVDCRLCRFSKGGLDRLSTDHPRLKDRLLENATGELDQAREHILLLGRKTSLERVASALLNFAERLTGEVRDGATFPLYVTRQDLADYLGVRIETVSRILSRMRRDGLIEEDKGAVTLQRAGLLKRAAEGGDADL